VIITNGKYTFEKTEGAIKNGQSSDTGNIGHPKHNTENKKE